MRYDLTPPSKPPADAALAYADSLTDSQADLFSADREMTWRLSRANGWAGVAIGALAGVGFCLLQSIKDLRPTASGMLAMLAVPVAMIVPGAALLAVAG